MSITISLTHEEEERRRDVAAKCGKPAKEVVLAAVLRLIPPQTPAEKLAGLASLLDGDPAEQRKTGEYLLRAIDEDRFSDRKLFS